MKWQQPNKQCKINVRNIYLIYHSLWNNFGFLPQSFDLFIHHTSLMLPPENKVRPFIPVFSTEWQNGTLNEAWLFWEGNWF